MHSLVQMNVDTIYDLVMAPLERSGLRRLRARVVAGAAGRVLEVGAGTGLNLPLYRVAAEVVATDPDPGMLRRAGRRAGQARVPVTLAEARAEALPFSDGSFDTVVATLVFCSVDDPERAFREVRRVLRPGGELRLLEHVRFPHPAVAPLQDLLTPAWSRLAGGCHLNRDTLRLATEAGFRMRELRLHLGGLVIEGLARRGRGDGTTS